ncbi:MAG: S-layer homology domain-containing protein [Candidatus Margulisiibacteriota bacterium]
MKKKLTYSVIFVMAVLLTKVYAADATDTGAGARAISLGGAYTAVLGSSYSLFSNPAGISSVSTPEIVSMYGELSSDVIYNMAGVVFPVRGGSIGLGYAGNRAGDVYTTAIDANGRVVPVASYSYSNDELILAYGGRRSKFHFGLNIKYLSKGGTARGAGFNCDWGAVFETDRGLDIGIAVKNIIPGSAGSIKWNNGLTEQMPLEIKTGLRARSLKNLSLIGEAVFKTGYPAEERAGVEWKIRDNLLLRFGAENLSLGAGGSYVNYSAGAGLSVSNIAIDYAYYYDTLLTYDSRHYISLSIQFPGKRDKTPSAALKVPEAAAKVSAEKIQITDVDKSGWASEAINYCTDKNLMSLNKKSGFDPEKPITRAEFAALLMKAAHEFWPPHGIKEKEFKDVPKSNWAKTYIGVAADIKYMSGYADGTFRPGRKVTLKEAVIVFNKYKGKARTSRAVAELIEKRGIITTPDKYILKRQDAAWMLYSTR